jgi:glutaredoxin 3
LESRVSSVITVSLSCLLSAIGDIYHRLVQLRNVIFSLAMSQVKVYSTTTCPYCHLEKDYLKSKGIDFEDILVDQDPAQIDSLVDACGSMGVPCTHIIKDDGTEENILGFDKARIDAALGLG